MRRIIVSIHSTFNGVVTGPASDKTNFMTWAQAGIEEIGETFRQNFDTVDTIMLGRGTYEDLVRKWPFVSDWSDVSESTLRLGEIINTMSKVIVAGENKIDDLQWGDFEAPTQINGSNIEEQISAIKEQDGGDIITFGSPTLVQALTNANLVDEYRILVHPVIVGEGEHLFDSVTNRKDLRLKSTKTFEHGAILVQYELVTNRDSS
jgi:dihydrofolate reductase